MAKENNTKYIIGIDEVGRGPIAGPVAVAAFKLPIDSYQLLIENAKEETKTPLRDSKKLSKKQREVWFKFLKKQKEDGKCDYVISFVSPEMIDKFGIAKCIQKALNESLTKVASRALPNFYRFTPEGSYTDKNLEGLASLSLFDIYLDGGLKAGEEYINQQTIIKGDELHPIISLASIVAKVTRDGVMAKYSKEYPEYGFENHSGYGTKAHYEAIKKYGQTKIHRKSFIH